MSIWLLVREGGAFALAAFILGFIGLFVALATILVVIVARRSAFGLGVASLVIAILASSSGVLGMWLGWTQTQRAVAGGSVDPIMRDRILREGFAESRSAAKVGFGASLLPLLCGAIGALVSSAKAKGGLAPLPMPAFAGAPPPPPEGSARFVVSGVAIVIALLTSGGAIAATAASPPPTKYTFDSEDSDAWAFASAIELVDTDPDRGCDDLDRALGTFWMGYDRSEWPRRFVRDPDPLFPGWRTKATKCVATIWGHVKTDVTWSAPPRAGMFAPSSKSWTREALLDSPLLVDEALHKEILATTAGTPQSLGLADAGVGGGRGEGIGLGNIGTLGTYGSHPTKSPSLRMGATTVNGRLPPEVIQRIVRQNFGRFRLCYETALKTNPSLDGKIVVSFVIDRTGAVSSVADGGSTIADTTMRKCVQDKFKDLSFPAPEGGIVTVSYPLIFTPG